MAKVSREKPDRRKKSDHRWIGKMAGGRYGGQRSGERRLGERRSKKKK